ncbi:MAG: hypothetical protein Q8882_09340 [Bacillota bacterium]|nr:hypothetical protein [Bacillota bacterium]
MISRVTEIDKKACAVLESVPDPEEIESRIKAESDKLINGLEERKVARLKDIKRQEDAAFQKRFDELKSEQEKVLAQMDKAKEAKISSIVDEIFNKVIS